MTLSENRCTPIGAQPEGMLFRVMLLVWRMILSENRAPLFGIMLFVLRMILSENRSPLFGIMR